MFKNVKNLLFDFGGVIINLKKERAVERFKEIGVADIDNYLTSYRHHGIFLDYELGVLDRPQFTEALRKLTGNEKISEADVDYAWQGFLDGIPEYKFQMLKDLRKKYKVYLLSNTNPSAIEWASTSVFSPSGEPIEAYFDECYMSYKIGHAKPDKEIFEYIIKDSGINPAETLFFDDAQKNIDAAIELGFQTYLTDQNEDLLKVVAQID